MNNRPLLSIGFPVYNGQRYLETTLSSILGQTFTDFVLTISDNGSTDATSEICREFAARDPRVRFHRSESNRGLSWNYNRVLELSSGKYFKWMADDDLYEPEFVERCVDVLERDPDVVLCYTRTVLIDEFGHRVKDWDDGYDIGTSSPSRRLAHLLEDADPLQPRVRRDTARVPRPRAFRQLRGVGHRLACPADALRPIPRGPRAALPATGPPGQVEPGLPDPRQPLGALRPVDPGEGPPSHPARVPRTPRFRRRGSDELPGEAPLLPADRSTVPLVSSRGRWGAGTRRPYARGTRRLRSPSILPPRRPRPGPTRPDRRPRLTAEPVDRSLTAHRPRRGS